MIFKKNKGAFESNWETTKFLWGSCILFSMYFLKFCVNYDQGVKKREVETPGGRLYNILGCKKKPLNLGSDKRDGIHIRWNKHCQFV